MRAGALCAGVLAAAIAPGLCDSGRTPGPSASQQPPGLRLYGDVIVRHNPKGVMAVGGAAWRHVYRRDPSPLWDGLYVQGGASLGLNPAYTQVSAHGEWLPAAVLQLRLQGDLLGYHGASGGLLSFPSAQAPFEDGARDALSGQEETKLGRRLMLQPTLRWKHGRWVLRNQTDLARYSFSGRGPFFLELEYDTLLEGVDDVAANRVQALWEAWRGSGERSGQALVGPTYEVTAARGSGLTRHRFGALAVWLPRPFWGLSRPRVVFQPGINATDPNRKGQLYFQLSAGADFDLGSR